jgi:hypothetical protein
VWETTSGPNARRPTVPTYSVPGVKNVAQMQDGTCWWAGAMVLYNWSKANGGSMSPPNDDHDIEDMWKHNRSWPTWNNDLLAQKLGLAANTWATDEVPSNFSEWQYFLSMHGPAWTSLEKNWVGNSHTHVVVIVGCQDDGVIILDPEPVGVGSRKMLNWDQLQKAFDGVNSDIRVMTAK